MSTNLGSLKICNVLILPQHKKEVQSHHDNAVSDLHYQKLSAAFWVRKLWKPGSTITYSFLDEPFSKKDNTSSINSSTPNVDPIQKEIEDMDIKEAIKTIVNKRIQPLSNLNFKFVENPDDANVRISFKVDNGAWAYCGTDCNGITDKKAPTMNLAWFDAPTTMHEFGHVLGLIHEHQNPKGGIQWNKSAVYSWAKTTQGWDEATTNTNILNKYDQNEINGSTFDPCSIMLYFFPGELTLTDIGTKVNNRLSGLDIKWIEQMYNVDTGSKLYNDFYNEDMDANIAKCEKQGLQYISSQSMQVGKIAKYTGIGFGVFIVLAVIVYIIWWFLKRMKTRKRYTK